MKSEKTFHEALREVELPVGRCRGVEIEGRTIVVYHTRDGFFATDNACPHRGGPLAEGDLIGNEIVCPWHLWSFDVTTGINPGRVEGREVSVCTHDVRVENGTVLVRVSDSERELA